MEELNKNSEEQTEDVQESTGQQSSPNRSNVLMLLAGLYLLYTGYKLCKNVLDGVEGGGWGFFAAGVGFLLVGAGMLFVSGKNFMKQDKEKRALEEAEAEKNSQEEKEENSSQSKSMTIAERARLAEKLKEAEETETSEE